MINSFYKFNSAEIDQDTFDVNGKFIQTITYKFKDYTYKNYSLVSEWDELNNEEWIEYYQLSDAEKIESVSFNLYGTADYWDIILGINFRSPLFDMVYNYDTIVDSVNEYVAEYERNYFGTMSDTHRTNLTTLFLNEELAKTEELRNIKVIRPSKIQDFFRLLRDRGFYADEK